MAFRDKVKLWIQTVIFYVILYLFCILKIKSKLKVNLVNANIFYILIIIHFDLFFQSQSQLYLKRVILTLTKSLFLPLSLTIYILFPFSRFSLPSLYFSGVTTTLLRWSWCAEGNGSWGYVCCSAEGSSVLYRGPLSQVVFRLTQSPTLDTIFLALVMRPSTTYPIF